MGTSEGLIKFLKEERKWSARAISLVEALAAYDNDANQEFLVNDLSFTADLQDALLRLHEMILNKDVEGERLAEREARQIYHDMQMKTIKAQLTAGDSLSLAEEMELAEELDEKFNAILKLYRQATGLSDERIDKLTDDELSAIYEEWNAFYQQ